MPLSPDHLAMLEKHKEHVAAFQKFCLEVYANEEMCDELGEMHYESMALGFLLGCGVPYDEAYGLAVIGSIEPEYPREKL